MGSTGYRRW